MVGEHHGECGARAYNGGLGSEPPAGSRGRAPGQGARGGKPPEAANILVIGCPTEPANLAPFQKCPFELRNTQQSLTETVCFVTVYWCQSWGAQSAWCPPTPSLGGCAPVPPGSAAYGDLTNEKFTIHHVIWAYIHTYILLIIYVITDENKLQLLYCS